MKSTKKSIKDSKSGDEFKEIFLKSPIGIILFDMDANISNANESALKMLGTPKLEDILGRNIFDFVPIAEKKEKLLKEGLIKFQAPLDLKWLKDFDYYHPTKEGVLFLDFTVSVIDSGFLVQIQDITERKKAEEELKESEEKFRILADSSPAAIGVYRDKRIIYANPASESILGYTKEELFKMDWFDIAHPDYKKIAKNAIKARMAGSKEKSHNEMKIITKEGKEKWLDVSSNLIQYEGSPAGLLIGTDITERKKMEETLRNAHDNLEEQVKNRTRELEEAYKALSESEEKFRELFNNAEDTITLGELIDGKPGKFIEVNEAATRKLGYSKEELLNMTPLDLTQKSIEESPKDVFKILETGSATFENVHVAKDGSKIPVEVNTHLFKLKGKDVILGISRDITERKMAEEELRESEEVYRIAQRII